jgi:hypothetical protein
MPLLIVVRRTSDTVRGVQPGADHVSEEEMKELILEVARAPVWPSSQALRLPADKTLRPGLICFDMKDWVGLAQAHYGLNDNPG